MADAGAVTVKLRVETEDAEKELERAREAVVRTHQAALKIAQLSTDQLVAMFAIGVLVGVLLTLGWSWWLR